MASKSFPPELVIRIRNMNLIDVLNSICTYCSQDRTYVPRKNPNSKLFIVEINGKRFNNLLLTGNRWFDLDSQKGGGGAIDLTMYLKGISFVQSVKLLSSLDAPDLDSIP